VKRLNSSVYIKVKVGMQKYVRHRNGSMRVQNYHTFIVSQFR
jgi:hypothetical protein